MNWNPFDLRGPEFLLLYLVFIVCLLVLQWALRRRREAPPDAAEGFGRALDPLGAGYLRAGFPGVVETAVAALVSKGTLRCDGRRLARAAQPASTAPGWERAAYAVFREPRPAERLAADAEFKRTVEAEIVRPLVAEGSAVGAENGSAAVRDALLVALSLVAAAGYKIHLAYERGKSNVGFLIALAILAVFGALVVGGARRATARGKARLAALRLLAPSRREPPDAAAAALAVGVWGVFALPAAALTDLRLALPQAPRRREDGGGCGTSCGASFGGGDGGGGDGGGGDGGGGGGCGGSGGCGGCGGD